MKQMQIETMTVAEAVEPLRAAWMKISPQTMQAGLQQGVYPFGVYIDRKIYNGGGVYYIFRRLREEWIAERGVEEDVEE